LDDKDFQIPCFLWVLLFPHKTTGKPISSSQLAGKFKAFRNWKIKVHENGLGTKLVIKGRYFFLYPPTHPN